MHDDEAVLASHHTRPFWRTQPRQHDDLIACGPLLSDDAKRVLGAAVLLEAPDVGRAREILDAGQYVGIEVHRWRFGGRP